MASVELFLQRYCYNSLQIFLSTRCTNNQNSLMPLGLALFPGSSQLFIVYSMGKILQVTESWAGPGNDATLGWFTSIMSCIIW